MMTIAMFMPGPLELAIIAVIAVLIFGRRLPKIARGIGSSVIEFKKGLKLGVDEVDEVKTELRDSAEEIRSSVSLKDKT